MNLSFNIEYITCIVQRQATHARNMFEKDKKIHHTDNLWVDLIGTHEQKYTSNGSLLSALQLLDVLWFFDVIFD
jgi:hypothetical protein